MGVPQICYIVIITLGLGISLAKHGEPQGDYNFFTTLIAAAIQIGLLILGGFFG
jgi:hypothetical protein